MVTRVITQRDVSQVTVARLAGVSRATVSLAFSGKGRMAEETRARITRIAGEIGYHPDLHMEARRLSARGSQTIPLTKTLGLIWNVMLGDDEPVGQLGSFYHKLLDGIMQGCLQRRQALQLLNFEPDQLQDLSFVTHVDGLILPVANSKYFQAAQRFGKPIVTIFGTGRNVADVGIDNAATVRVAFQHLYAHGHRQIGMIGPALESVHASLRWSAYCACLQQAGLAYNKAHVWTATVKGFRPDAEAAFREIWAGADRPTALIVYNDWMALQILTAAAEMGIRVPDDVSLVSIDDIPEAAHSQPPLTTVAIQIEEIGRQAALLLEGFTRTGTYREEHIQVEVALQSRASVRTITAL